ncbi:FxLD family lanthipeptide [Catellatospora methionotrophica]|uniref:FxLD family lanthipeptide n=1 Tax=Catellatospora methionotrophica TaxID=121620 RepID=UPI0033D08E6C
MQAGNDVQDAFALDLRVTDDVPPGLDNKRCDTNDGCAGTCASSCVTHSPN